MRGPRVEESYVLGNLRNKKFVLKRLMRVRATTHERLWVRQPRVGEMACLLKLEEKKFVLKKCMQLRATTRGKTVGEAWTGWHC